MESTSSAGDLSPCDSIDNISDISIDSRRSSLSGRNTPTGSGITLARRTSLKKLNQEKRAKKINFFRNGDKYHKGHLYVFSRERIRTFDALMEDLTRVLAHQNSLPKGVRYIFSIDGNKITNLDQLAEDEEYVCSSTDKFVKLNYVPNVKRRHSMSAMRHSEESLVKCYSDIKKSEPRDFVKPKLVTIIRNGNKPRKFIRFLLNKKTAHSFEQVLRDLTTEVKLDSGVVKKVYTLDGKEVVTLAGFFSEDDTFIVYGTEKCNQADFEIDGEEYKQLSKVSKNAFTYSKFRRSCSSISSPICKDKLSYPGYIVRESPASTSRNSLTTSPRFPAGVRREKSFLESPLI